MPEQVIFGMEVFLNGLMAGVLYALVALGFVLIYNLAHIVYICSQIKSLHVVFILWVCQVPRSSIRQV